MRVGGSISSVPLPISHFILSCQGKRLPFSDYCFLHWRGKKHVPLSFGVFSLDGEIFSRSCFHFISGVCSPCLRHPFVFNKLFRVLNEIIEGPIRMSRKFRTSIIFCPQKKVDFKIEENYSRIAVSCQPKKLLDRMRLNFN